MKNPRRFHFFNSHSYVLPFTVIECMVGDVLKKNGVTPVFVKPTSCTCQLIPQINRSAAGEENPCEQCRINDSVLRRATPGWPSQTLAAFRRKEDAAKADSLVMSLETCAVQSFIFEGIEIGKIALHDTLLHHKQDTLDFKAETPAWMDFVALVRACILTALALRRFLKETPGAGFMVYNSHYSINRTAIAVAEQEGFPTFSMHGGASLKYLWDTLMLARGDIDQHKPACVANWNASYSNRPLARKEMRLVEGHFNELFCGSMAHAYSAPAGSARGDDLFAKVNPSGARKVLLAATSSADERFALEQSGIRTVFSKEEYLFPTQIDWLDFLISRMRESPELGLIIRIHPREMPNKREGGTSTNARRLHSMLVDLPENVVINWPKDDISFYDLMLRVDLVLTCWSSVVLESSLFGCPIILPYNPVKYYDVVADRVCGACDEYWDAVKEHAGAPWTIERAVQTLRWFWVVQFGSNVSLFSEKHRDPGLFERLVDQMGAARTFLEQETGRHVPDIFSNHTRAYWGEYRDLTRRRIDYEGEAVIAKTLLGDFNPLLDFRELQRLQPAAYGSGQGPDSAGGCERIEALSTVKRMLAVLRKKQDAATALLLGKVDAMVLAAEVELRNKKKP